MRGQPHAPVHKLKLDAYYDYSTRSVMNMASVTQVFRGDGAYRIVNTSALARSTAVILFPFSSLLPGYSHNAASSR